MPALLIGSMGVIADTSERQRRAYNEAYAEHSVPVYWSQSEYQLLLRHSGGQRRIDNAIRDLSGAPCAEELHRAKAKRFQTDVRTNGVICRPGIVSTVRDAKRAGFAVAFVTTTDLANLEAILEAGTGLSIDDFDCVLHQGDVDERKPHPEVYHLAVKRLGLSAADCVAIEDNADGLASAVSAGVRCYAYPGENNAGHDFRDAEATLSKASFDVVCGKSAVPSIA